jgi:hypothetical protein
MPRGGVEMIADLKAESQWRKYAAVPKEQRLYRMVHLQMHMIALAIELCRSRPKFVQALANI